MKRDRRPIGAWRRSPQAWAIVAGGVFVLLVASGHAGEALRAFWVGSFGSWYAFTSGTLVRAVPLLLTGLGVALAFRAGVFNIGADGQLLMGATAGALVSVQWSPALGPAVVPVSCLAGALAGAGWASVAAFLKVRFGVLEVISTLMLNFVAADFVSYLVRGPFQEPQHIYPQSPTLPAVARIPHFGPATRLHWGFFIAVALTLVAAWAVARTAAGFRLRVAGANPAAAWTTGRVRVSRVSTMALLLSGALSGLAGAIEVGAVTYAVYENLSPGFGFTAIAVAILAGLQPLGVLPSAILFAGLESGATAMQRDAGVPAAWATAVEACLILFIVGAVAIRTRRLVANLPGESS